MSRTPVYTCRREYPASLIRVEQRRVLHKLVLAPGRLSFRADPSFGERARVRHARRAVLSIGDWHKLDCSCSFDVLTFRTHVYCCRCAREEADGVTREFQVREGKWGTKWG